MALRDQRHQGDGGDLYANWARVYDYFRPARLREIEFWTRLALAYGRRLLDLMCGTAEVSLGLARCGHRVLGVDLSPAMLAVGARRLASAADYPARSLLLVQGDASSIPALDDEIDFALVGGSGSFNHLDDDLAATALGGLCRVLRPGGALGMELVNPYLLQELPSVRSFGPFRPTPPGVRVRRTVSTRSEGAAGLFHIRQATSYDIDGVRGEFEESFALRLWEPEDVRSLLKGAGFAGVQFYGDYDLGAFDRWSSDLLVVTTTRSGTSSLFRRKLR